MAKKLAITMTHTEERLPREIIQLALVVRGSNIDLNNILGALQNLGSNKAAINHRNERIMT